MELSSEYRRNRYPKDIVPKPCEKRDPNKNPLDTRKWNATESTINFNFSNLVKKIKKHLTEQFPGLTPEQASYKTKESLKSFTLNNQFFHYESIPNTLGGVRWFVLCPKCKKRSLKLYLPKAKDRESLYLCKDCHKLKPSSMLLGGRSKYKHITRPLKRIEQIKKKLLNKKTNIEEVDKLFKELDKIEKKLSESAEYRLWKFKKEHKRT